MQKSHLHSTNNNNNSGSITTMLSESGWEVICGGEHGVVVELNKAIFVQNRSWS